VLPEATITVVEATVGATLQLTVQALWETAPLATGAASGTITSIAVADGSTVTAGDELYRVNLRPVVVAQGEVPAFRDLAQGDSGDDVAQLQEFLAATGYFTGAVTGQFNNATRSAVQNWQRSLGVAANGVVSAGDLVFAPTLPTRVALAASITVGAMVTPGQTVLYRVAPAPDFTARIDGTVQQAAIPPTGGAVEVLPSADLDPWLAVVANSTVEGGATILTLTAADGGPVCAQACEAVPLTDGATLYSGRAIIAPELTGPALPAAAVGTAPDGSHFVRTPQGERISVEILAADAARLILDGVSVGQVVQLFADAGSTTG